MSTKVKEPLTKHDITSTQRKIGNFERKNQTNLTEEKLKNLEKEKTTKCLLVIPHF